jgi:hypothetical protein
MPSTAGNISPCSAAEAPVRVLRAVVAVVPAAQLLGSRQRAAGAELRRFRASDREC